MNETSFTLHIGADTILAGVWVYLVLRKILKNATFSWWWVVLVAVLWGLN